MELQEAAPRDRARVRSWAAHADRMHATIAAGDESGARQVLDRLGGSVSVAELCEQMIAPALYRIGAQCARGDATVAAEHRAAAICARLITARMPQPPGRPRGIAVVAAPPGEQHALPSLMAAAALREDGWLVHHLAAPRPAASVAGLAVSVSAELVVLSSATAETSLLALQAKREIAAAAPGVRVLAAGPGDTIGRLLRLARDPASPAG